MWCEEESRFEFRKRESPSCGTVSSRFLLFVSELTRSSFADFFGFLRNEALLAFRRSRAQAPLDAVRISQEDYVEKETDSGDDSISNEKRARIRDQS